jgi:hypothetical protein
MKHQDYINRTSENFWYRCKRVTFADEIATWELSQTGRYEFSEAYKMAPHRQLIRATDDDSLRAFVKAWGPLRNGLNAWSGTDSIAIYRRVRDRLVVSARLLASVEEPELQRPALLVFVKSLSADDMFPSILAGLKKRRGPSSDVEVGVDVDNEEWVKSLTQKQLDSIAREVAPFFAVSAISHGYTVERKKTGNILKASLMIPDLKEAMIWMMWQDVAQSHPMQFCVECRELIEFTTHHAKRFCSHACAHRRTGREWQQRKREKERHSNGTQKAR